MWRWTDIDARLQAELKSKHQAALRLHEADLDQLVALRAQQSDLQQQLESAVKDLHDATSTIEKTQASIHNANEVLKRTRAEHGVLQGKVCPTPRCCGALCAV